MMNNLLFNSSVEYCLKMTFEQSIQKLKGIIGNENFNKALNIEFSYPSFVSEYKDTSWAQSIKIIGVNPRITKTFFGIVKYAMSFPERGIHIMPLFESGDGSLYVQNSWNLNNDFLDADLYKMGYYTSESQLKLVINFLHALGKIVGFDSLPHVDNFSRIVLVNPEYFEWIKLNDSKTAQIFSPQVDYNELYKEVQSAIIETLGLTYDLFSLSEKDREEIIFPKNIDEFQIRMRLRKAIRDKGLEPLPVVEHIPMRPIVFEKFEENGKENWATFTVDAKDKYSKVFGGITPYKLYRTDEEGYPIKNGELFEVWNYFADKTDEFQRKYNFDFLRADMAHNQISHSHKYEEKDINCNELWSFVRDKIRKNKPYFATMAESFYSTYYVDGISDMINKKFDIVLGNMNFKKLNKNYLDFVDDFLNPFRENFRFFPCIAIYTNDGDLPEHNDLYSSNKENIARCFISLFLNLPSYMGIGFEQRDINPVLTRNYSHQYVKKQNEEYLFGRNIEFFTKLAQLRQLYSKMETIINTYNFKQLYGKNNEQSLNFMYIGETNAYLFTININPNDNLIILDSGFSKINPIYTSSNRIITKIKKGNLEIQNIMQYDFAVFECIK